MSVLQNVLLAILALSVLTFVVLFGQLPALRKTPIGWLQRALSIHFPNGIQRLDGWATGGRFTQLSRRLGHYLFYEKNPVVLILFLFLLIGSVFLFLYNSLQYLSWTAIAPIPFIVVAPLILTYLTAAHTNHFVSHSSHNARLNDYPYDHVLFRPGVVCTTCNLVKPARSKHCSLCGTCVAKCDHHCPWVNACLGLGNYHYFLFLLASLTLVQVYGAYLSFTILRPHLGTVTPGLKLFSSQWMSEFGDGLLAAVEIGGLSIAGVGLLAASTASLPLGLLGYHLYLIWAGMTTNESQKWADWRDDMADGYVFRASRAALLDYQQQHRQVHRIPSGDATDGNGRPSAHGNDLLQDLGILGLDGELIAEVDWPVRSDQVVVRTDDGKPPRGQEGLWMRVWQLGEVDNIYDLGGWDNYMDVLKGR